MRSGFSYIHTASQSKPPAQIATCALSRSRESVVWGSGRECEEAVRRHSHLREFMFQGVKVNSCSHTPATSVAQVELPKQKSISSSLSEAAIAKTASRSRGAKSPHPNRLPLAKWSRTEVACQTPQAWALTSSSCPPRIREADNRAAVIATRGRDCAVPLTSCTTTSMSSSYGDPVGPRGWLPSCMVLCSSHHPKWERIPRSVASNEMPVKSNLKSVSDRVDRLCDVHNAVSPDRHHRHRQRLVQFWSLFEKL